MSRIGWKMARKAVKNAKRNESIDAAARGNLPDFDTEDEESDSDESNSENRPVASSSKAVKAQDSAQPVPSAKGKGKAKEGQVAGSLAATGAGAASVIPPADAAGR